MRILKCRYLSALIECELELFCATNITSIVAVALRVLVHAETWVSSFPSGEGAVAQHFGGPEPMATAC